MLAPSGGGLILYQAYGNLYAMTGRKAHLLEDKQIPSVGVFDEKVNPSSTLESLSQESLDTTYAKFTTQINKLLAMRQTIDSLLFKTINEMTDQSSDFEIFCPEERIKELELRTQRRNNFEEGLFKDRIREKSFHARRNPYQPYKFCNFVGRAKNMHIFIGCFVYVVDFMILEELGSIIESGLSEVVLGQPFARTSKLTYDESLGLISHLEEIIVRRQDDQLYKFREGDFKRLHRQDIEDMLLLLVQGKLTNLNLEERFALNVTLRMYTRRIVIQERVEDLQLGVESY
ncbi:hypothetical protein Tco_0195724 [Tanacetum coccineum]